MEASLGGRLGRAVHTLHRGQSSPDSPIPPLDQRFWPRRMFRLGPRFPGTLPPASFVASVPLHLGMRPSSPGSVAASAPLRGASSRATPKSMTLTRGVSASRSTSRFEGFKSRCTTPRWWAWCTASAAWASSSTLARQPRSAEMPRVRQHKGGVSGRKQAVLGGSPDREGAAESIVDAVETRPYGSGEAKRATRLERATFSLEGSQKTPF